MSFFPSLSTVRMVTTCLWSQSSSTSGFASPGLNLFSITFLALVLYPLLDLALMPVSDVMLQLLSSPLSIFNTWSAPMNRCRVHGPAPRAFMYPSKSMLPSSFHVPSSGYDRTTGEGALENLEGGLGV